MKKIIILVLSTCLLIPFLIPTTHASLFEESFEASFDSIIANNYRDVLEVWRNEGLRDDIEFEGIISPSSFSFASNQGEIILDELYLSYLQNNHLPESSNGEVFKFNDAEDVIQSLKATI